MIPLYLKYLNNRHARRREELGKTAQVVDESMMRKHEMQDSKAIELEESNAHHQVSVDEDNGLHDMTDLKNEDFIYVY